MDESSSTPNSSSDQQTLPAAIRAVRRQESQPEVVLRIEPDGRYLRLARNVGQPLSFMMNYSDAKRVQNNRGGFDGEIDPRHELFVTGTEENEKVTNRDRYSVLDFLKELDRKITYIPDWGWVSKQQDEQRRIKVIGRYVERVEWLHFQVKNLGLPVQIRPLAKGLNSKHFRESVEGFRRLGLDEVAIYGVQTPSNRELVTRTEQAISVLDPVSVMLIGRGVPRQLRDFPRRVDAIASWRAWTNACNLSADYYSEFKLNMWIQQNLHTLKRGHEQVQTGIDQFDSAVSEVTADG